MCNYLFTLDPFNFPIGPDCKDSELLCCVEILDQILVINDKELLYRGKIVFQFPSSPSFISVFLSSSLLASLLTFGFLLSKVKTIQFVTCLRIILAPRLQLMTSHP